MSREVRDYPLPGDHLPFGAYIRSHYRAGTRADSQVRGRQSIGDICRSQRCRRGCYQNEPSYCGIQCGPRTGGRDPCVHRSRVLTGTQARRRGCVRAGGECGEQARGGYGEIGRSACDAGHERCLRRIVFFYRTGKIAWFDCCDIRITTLARENTFAFRFILVMMEKILPLGIRYYVHP